MFRFAFAVCQVAAAAAVAAGPPADPGKDATPRPPAPKLDPGSAHTPLLPAGELLLEKAADGRKRVLAAAEVCLREGPLEVFACKRGTKEHEAVVRVDMDPKFIHFALIAAGAKPGSPVQFVDPKSGQPAYKPAAGGRVRVSVCYTRDGKPHTRPAQEWVTDTRTGKPMAHRWVFAGSRFLKHPDRPADPPYYAANGGEVISISNFPDSMLELPVAVSTDNAALAFEAATAEIPPLLSKVWVILEPEAEAGKAGPGPKE